MNAAKLQIMERGSVTRSTVACIAVWTFWKAWFQSKLLRVTDPRSYRWGSCAKTFAVGSLQSMLVATAFLFCLLSHLHATEIIESDVCIYGGTAGGVAAAVETARLGKSAVIANSAIIWAA